MAGAIRRGQRLALWTLVTLAVTVVAFVVGTRVWERRNCGAPNVTDCDMGPFLGGAPFAGVVLLAMATVVVSVEVRRGRRRRSSDV